MTLRSAVLRPIGFRGESPTRSSVGRVTTALLGLCLLATASIAGPVSAAGAPSSGPAGVSGPVQADLLLSSGDQADPPGSDGDAFRPGHGAFRWPTSGRLTQLYGCTGFRLNSRRGRCAFFHNGIDVANRRGTPIHAAAAGVVTYVGWDPYDRSRDPAWVVIVRHAGSLRSWYAHLLPRRVNRARVGDRVKQGQLIGYMGMTGRATGVHLHFMARYGGKFVNPARFLPRGSKPPRTQSAWARARLGDLRHQMGVRPV